MLGLNLWLALLVALFFGLAGLPLGFWLRRKENLPLLDTLLIGYTLGWVLIPLLFLVESLAGILYSTPLIAINYLLVAGAGMVLLFKDGALSPSAISKSLRLAPPSELWPAIRRALPGLALVLLLVITVLIRLSAAGGLIFELDPYFYLDGVRQVVYEGHNFYDDHTAWVNLGPDGQPSGLIGDAAISHHVGQPLFKYLLAPWFSMYNGNAPYSPYTLVDIGGIYPPLAAGLAVFFIYLFFREMYNERAGLLAGGLAAFLPFFLLKQLGGDTQIVPYSIFAIFFFLAMFYMMLKRRSWALTLMAGVAYGAIVLGSNIEILLVFCLSLLLFGIGVRHILQPDDESRQLNRQLLLFLGLMFIVQVINLVYSGYHLGLKDWITALVENVGLPTIALFLPLAFDWFAEMPNRHGKSGQSTHHPVHAGHSAQIHTSATQPDLLSNLLRSLSSLWQSVESSIAPILMPLAQVFFNLGRTYRAALFVILLIILAVLAPRLPGLSMLATTYQFWGAYAEPLYRTIAEQAPGSTSFDGSFGFVSMTLDPAGFATTTLPGTLINLSVQFMSLVNTVPTALLNAGYNTVASMLNVLLFPNGDGNFISQERTNSLTTFFLFFGPLFLLLRWLWGALTDEKTHWPLVPMLLLSFIVPITFMGFEKQKLLTYLGMALIMAAAATLGEGEILLRQLASSLASNKNKAPGEPMYNGWPVQPRHLSWFVVFSIIVLEMGAFGISAAWGLPLLQYAFTPTFQQAPAQTVAHFSALCKTTNDAGFCQAAGIDLNATLSNPVAFYDANLCYLSLLPNTTSQASPALGTVLQYRCGYLTPYWLASMEWIHQNVPNDTATDTSNRVISWWDYGHWINFFGQHNTVLRNEHNSKDMIGRTAYAYLDNDTAYLRSTMKRYDSRYALMDVEIVGGGSAGAIQYGGKYGALNYLACAYVNDTTVNTPLGTSNCETSHLWETIIVPSQPQNAQNCVISESTQQSGYVAYRLAYVRTAQGMQQQPTPAYCITGGTLINGQQAPLTYDLNSKDANGDLQLHPALWEAQGNDGNNIFFGAVYDHQKLWNVNGTAVESWPYRVGAFYDSPLYQGFFLDHLDGFDLVYNSPQVRIYKMTDAAWASTVMANTAIGGGN